MALDNITPESEARRALPSEAVPSEATTLYPYEALIYGTEHKVGSTVAYQFNTRMRNQGIDLEGVTVLIKIPANTSTLDMIWQMEQMTAVAHGYEPEHLHVKDFVKQARSKVTKWIYHLTSVDGDHTVTVTDPKLFEVNHKLYDGNLNHAASPNVRLKQVVVGGAAYTVTRELRE
jgi:hypothetical protein